MLASALLLFVGSFSLTAQEPVPIGGHVLILDNERVLEGAVERQGELYVIRGTVGEVKVPVAKALAVCTTLQDAFKFLSDRANQRDPDERLRLAHWCNNHGLQEQALAEAQAALQLRPGHLDTIRLLAVLQRAGAPAIPPLPAAPAPLSIEPEPLEVTSDCRALFATKVQPILMNTCASCHAAGKGGAFVLTRPSGLVGQSGLQANLRAVVGQISFDRPTASPLLRKACTAHGGAAKAALTYQPAPPFSTLELWVELLVANHPHLKSHGAAAVAAAPPPPEVHAQPVKPRDIAPISQAPGKDSAATPTPRQVELVPSALLPPTTDGTVYSLGRSLERVDCTTPAPGTDASASARPSAALEAAPPAPASPYDPAPFNAMAHPSK